MASNWRATMPKDKPQSGNMQIVFAVMDHKGARIEFSGVVTDVCAAKMLALATEKSLSKDLTPN